MGWCLEDLPEPVHPADGHSLKEHGDEEGDAGGIVLEEAEDVEASLKTY
jgi:hypothetical protein